MRTSLHAEIRSQQRGIPPLIDVLLDDYGSEEHVGDGRVLKFFTKQSIRRMESSMGRAVVSRLATWHDCYKIVGSDGYSITIGHRFQRVRRK